MLKGTLKFIKRKIAYFDKRYTKGGLYLISRLTPPGLYFKIMEMSKRPVIIGGCGRSGTTLILSLLSTHPKLLAIPFETYAFCPGVYRDDVGREAPFDIVDIYSHILERKGISSKNRWVEKSPKNVQFIGRIIDYLGDGARFIHIVRDGRDVVTSRHPDHPNKYHVSPKRWVKDVKSGMKMESHRQVKTIRYEDIVEDYKREMKNIIDFIGEEYVREIEEYPKSSTIKDSPAWFAGARNIEKSSTNRWEKKEHQEVVDELMSLEGAEGLLSHYGYI